MSTSRKARPARRGAKNSAATPAALPLTVSRRALLERGSDTRFRTLVHDLLTISTRMELVRGHLGARMGVSGPQYSLLVAVARLQGEEGASVTAVAKALHVSSAFVASETSKLAQRGLVSKRTSPHDRRVVLLSIAPAGRIEIGRIGDEIRIINDLFFGALDSKTFAALSAAVGSLVTSSRKAIQHIGSADRGLRVALEAAE
ncbi:MAG: MarR family winged helix-turn-helix transcriptional regulator [Xanthobacteraceae bacterium]|jgi:DNA-binding MarR family transcriptional regulator